MPSLCHCCKFIRNDKNIVPNKGSSLLVCIGCIKKVRIPKCIVYKIIEEVEQVEPVKNLPEYIPREMLKDRKLDTSKRFQLYRRDDYTCFYCETDLLKPNTPQITLDHVIPKRLGGKDSAKNLVTACIKCNTQKSSKFDVWSIEETLKAVEKRNKIMGIDPKLRIPFTKRKYE
jgi:5-methylcytosine-specific restriction endonuclease McrA